MFRIMSLLCFYLLSHSGVGAAPLFKGAVLLEGDHLRPAFEFGHSEDHPFYATLNIQPYFYLSTLVGEPTVACRLRWSFDALHIDPGYVQAAAAHLAATGSPNLTFELVKFLPNGDGGRWGGVGAENFPIDVLNKLRLNDVKFLVGAGVSGGIRCDAGIMPHQGAGTVSFNVPASPAWEDLFQGRPSLDNDKAYYERAKQLAEGLSRPEALNGNGARIVEATLNLRPILRWLSERAAEQEGARLAAKKETQQAEADASAQALNTSWKKMQNELQEARKATLPKEELAQLIADARLGLKDLDAELDEFKRAKQERLSALQGKLRQASKGYAQAKQAADQLREAEWENPFQPLSLTFESSHARNPREQFKMPDTCTQADDIRSIWYDHDFEAKFEEMEKRCLAEALQIKEDEDGDTDVFYRGKLVKRFYSGWVEKGDEPKQFVHRVTTGRNGGDPCEGSAWTEWDYVSYNIKGERLRSWTGKTYYGELCLSAG